MSQIDTITVIYIVLSDVYIRLLSDLDYKHYEKFC